MLDIDLYTDITCPWCLVGQHRLDKVLAERFPGAAVTVRHHPVLLLPDAPAEGVLVADMLRDRYGVTDTRPVFARPEGEARVSGLALDLDRQPRAYRTQAAHALILAAEERGTAHPLASTISRAYFLDGANIADPAALADLAVDHGFDRDEAVAIATDPAWHARVEAEVAKSSARGVRSVPHFTLGGRIELSGGRSEAELEAAIRDAMRG